MKNQKFNPELLKEELKRFKMLETYDFYHEEKDFPDRDKPLLLGTDLDEQGDDEAAAADISKELGVDDIDDQPADGEAPPPDAEAPPADAPPADAGAPPPADTTAPPPPPPAEPVEPPADEEEIDVTALVQNSKDAEKSADKASFYSSMMLKKLDDLEKRVGDMDKVTQQIDDLEREIKVRNPTPNEKLEMQSIVSGPYTQKLSDYWADKEGAYDVMNTDKKKEYVLTKQNLNHDYNEPEVKKSFDINNDYEEEDI